MSEKKFVKTVRFDENDYKTIGDFLKKNPAIDFSTLIRLAVSNYIVSPTLNPLNKLKSELENKEQRWN